MVGRWGRLGAVVMVAVSVASAGVVGSSSAVSAQTPRWLVTVGDSAISGEAGRWAGNTNGPAANVDALGPTAYGDDATGTNEQIPGCHRSKAAEAYIGGGVMGLNLACSGARTYTQAGSGDFKPGLDFYADGSGRKGQALMLQEFAAGHDVDAVTVLIGANNFGFADIVTRCVTNWLTSPSWWRNYCSDDADISSRFTTSAVEARTEEVKGAILNVRQAMLNAGYADGDYRLIVQLYSSPIPAGSLAPQAVGAMSAMRACGAWCSSHAGSWRSPVALVTFPAHPGARKT